MPNWCDNSLILKHDDPKFIARAIKAFKKQCFLHEFVPVPKGLMDTPAAKYADNDKQSKQDGLEQYNKTQYGYDTWYDFCVAEWGTKWDVGGTEDDITELDANSVRFIFQSAWNPPIHFYEKMESMGFSIYALYYEPGAGFCGLYTNGQDDYYETYDTSIEELESVLPEEIDQEFNVIEQLREWQEENEDRN